MDAIGCVVCCGSKEAPSDSWRCSNHVGINRLYYIHSGTGGYAHKGKLFQFAPGSLYYIPYTADFTPYCRKQDPIMHTYIDFELVPPIITDRILSLDAGSSESLCAAVNIFVLGGRMIGENNRDLSPLYADASFWELFKASVIYLTNQIAIANRIKKITDVLVINALETIHARMNEKLTVNGLARDCYMNPDSFIRRFSRVVGVTPHAYLKNLRLCRARHLRESGMSLSQAANEVGYSDASALAHALQTGDFTA